jgi:hypothetical protein
MNSQLTHPIPPVSLSIYIYLYLHTYFVHMFILDTAENRGVGITGGMDYVDMDGPSVVIRLKGRFWHERTTVLTRVANYLQQRIPEIVDVTIEDPFQLTDEANEVW